MKRILENEAMNGAETALGYDKIVEQHYRWLIEPHVNRILKLTAFEQNKKLSILDIGCGTGRLSLEIAKKAQADVYSVDCSLDMLRVLDANMAHTHTKGGVRLISADAKKLPFRDRCFDVVVCVNMFHHMPDPLGALRQIKRVVKDDGIVILSDLTRPVSPILVDLYVSVFGVLYDDVMKKQYRNSLSASFSAGEWRRLAARLGRRGLTMFNSFPHYINMHKKMQRHS